MEGLDVGSVSALMAGDGVVLHVPAALADRVGPGVNLSVDMITGDVALVELDVESEPRPRNRAERRAARHTRPVGDPR